MKTLFTSDQEYYSYEDLVEDLQNVLQENVKQPRGEVVFYVPLSKRSSRYGSISHNNKYGYAEPKTDLLSGILSITADTFEVFVDENNSVNGKDNLLQVRYYDHDGINTVTWRAITKSNKDKHNNVKQYGSHEEYIDYLLGRPAIKVK